MASRTRHCDTAAIVQHRSGAGAPALRAFVERQRWFAAKARGLGSVRVEDWATLYEDPPLVLLLIQADDTRYFVPVACASVPCEPQRTIGSVSGQTLLDAHWHPDFGHRLLEAMAGACVLVGAHGTFRCAAVEPRDRVVWAEAEHAPARAHRGEQSNTSIVFDGRLILKSIRRPESGGNPELEMLRFLTGLGFSNVPRLAGWVEYADHGGKTTVALLQEYVANTGDGWTHVLRGLDELCARLAATDNAAQARAGTLGADIHELGAVSGRLHAALASNPDLPGFCPELITGEDVGQWRYAMLEDMEELAAEIATAAPRMFAARTALEVLHDA